MKSKSRLIIIGVAVSLCCALYAWYHDYKGKQTGIVLSTQEKKVVEKIVGTKVPYCIGRYSLEIPESMELDNNVTPVVRFDDTSVISQHLYYPSFEQRIRLRETELRKIKPINPEDGSYLKAVYPLDNGEKGVVFERMESIDIPDSERMLEAHYYKDKVAFIIELKARNETAERYFAEVKQYPQLGGNSVPQKLIQLKQLIRNIGALDGNKVLSASDICIPNAVLSIEGLKSLKQNITVTLRSSKYPQLSIILETRNHSPDDQSLLSFRRYAEPIIEKNGGYVIRKGQKVINGVQLQEWLAKNYRQNKNEFYDFYLLINGEQAAENKPTLFVNLMWDPNQENQKLTDALQLSDAEMLAIWDEIINTIHKQSSSF